MVQQLDVRAIKPGSENGSVITSIDGEAVWELPITPARTLDSLVDVDTTTDPPEDGEALVWDEGLGLWVPGAIDPGPFEPGATELDQLTDVDTITIPPVEGDTLRYDASTSQWRPAAPDATALVPLTTVIAGVPQLVWDADDQLVMTAVPL